MSIWSAYGLAGCSRKDAEAANRSVSAPRGLSAQISSQSGGSNSATQLKTSYMEMYSYIPQNPATHGGARSVDQQQR
ncbi:hypothetical protein G6O67_006193 [Ophiocordyceps sinensis]|uniref:Uncharacterized protein n=1 Tax=Ophiocordyceps sinensis TaxID=72228 RepID=A0A8H4LWD4_9HYPO|nr:hypothetical protein G6O67_006193 [Ophiocordyceps sinensis]